MTKNLSKYSGRILTQERLKELISYNEDTGEFTSNTKGIVLGWVDNGYIRLAVDGIKYQAHRLAFLYMEGSFPVDIVDHINRNRSDNRWVNLRHANHSINHRNKGISKVNTSGVKGVHWLKGNKKWRASITNNDNKKEHLGCFEKKADAARARRSAEIKYGYKEA